MKREIKFRAFHKADMLYSEKGQFYIVPMGIDIPSSTGHEFYNVDAPLMQYTGLKDKNGTDIYEGDIVKSEYHSPSRYEIRFIEGGFCAHNDKIKSYPIDINHFYPSTGCDLTVIGNIHQNPELL